MFSRTKLSISTRGRGLYEITTQVQAAVHDSRVDVGLCTVFVHHTSASLIITENADPDVLRDLGAFLQRLVPDGDALYRHVDEGPDDMPSHVRSALTQCSIGVPVEAGSCELGTWQGIFLWEHRHAPHTRRVSVLVNGA